MFSWKQWKASYTTTIYPEHIRMKTVENICWSIFLGLPVYIIQVRHWICRCLPFFWVNRVAVLLRNPLRSDRRMMWSPVTMQSPLENSRASWAQGSYGILIPWSCTVASRMLHRGTAWQSRSGGPPTCACAARRFWICVPQGPPSSGSSNSRGILHKSNS